MEKSNRIQSGQGCFSDAQCIAPPQLVMSKSKD